MFQHNVVALRVRRHQAQSAAKRFILGQRDVLSGHVFAQPRTFGSAVRHDGLLDLTVDALLGPIGSRDKAIQAGELEQQAHQANATGADFGTHEVGAENQTMQERKTRGTLEKGHHGGMLIEALLVRRQA